MCRAHPIVCADFGEPMVNVSVGTNSAWELLLSQETGSCVQKNKTV